MVALPFCSSAMIRMSLTRSV